MRVLLVCVEVPSPLGGGIGTSVSNLYSYLKDKVDLTLLVSSRYIKNTSLSTSAVIIPSFGRSILEITSFGRNAARFINKYHSNFDVIHLHLPLALGVLRYIERDVLNKTLVTFHTTYAGYKRMFKLVKWSELKTIDDVLGKLCYYSIMSKLEGKLSKRIKYVSAVSTGIADEIKSFYGIDGVEIIPNGIKPPIEKKMRNSISIGHVLFVGRLVMQKGIMDLIKAVEILKNNNYLFKLNICGQGYLKEIIQRYIHKKKLNNYVKLLGYVPRDFLNRLYDSSQVGVMPSLYEGLPMVGLEMSSCGLPIVATETARIQDVICDENFDLLVPPRDSEKLAERIGYLLENPGDSIKIGKKNMKRCKHVCALSKVGNMYLKLYEEVAN